MFSKLANIFLITNKKTRQPSYTTTAFIIGFGVITLKLLVSGLTIYSYKMSDVSISDWAAGLTALSAMWVANKHVNNLQKNKSTEQ